MLPAPLVSVVTSKNPGRAVLCSAPVKLVLSLPNSLSGWMDSGVVGQLAVVKDAELDTIFFQASAVPFARCVHVFTPH